LRLGKAEEALTAINMAIDLKPARAGFYNSKGNVLSYMGQNEAALESYNKSKALKPEVATLHKNIGQVLCKLGRYQESLEAYSEAVKLDPQDTMASKGKERLLKIVAESRSEAYVDTGSEYPVGNTIGVINDRDEVLHTGEVSELTSSSL